MSIKPDGIQITYAAYPGAFYALMTLRQMMLASPGNLPCCEIFDRPGLSLRGMMLDVSRGKVPTLETLKQTVDFLAAFKYNHLELYFEGFSFAYPSFPKYWREDGALLPEEIRELDAYCRARFIDLVPNQNSLGHMAPWLEKEEFASLAELEGGFRVGELQVPPTTLNARDERSLKLVETMTEDMTACFSSNDFHAAMDEPFELGRGKNKAFVEQYGKGTLFLEYVEKIHSMLQKKGKRMMMWGDVAAGNEEILRQIPEDVIIMDWGYEAQHPVEKRAAALKKSGHAFCLCPGTNSWTTFTGMTDNMMMCITRAAQAAQEYGAYGAMLTDWGDCGHMQYLPVSYAPMVLAGALFWNPAGAECPEEYKELGKYDGAEKAQRKHPPVKCVSSLLVSLADALDRYVFRDANYVLGDVAVRAGIYDRLEEFQLPCTTLAGATFKIGTTKREEWEKGISQTMWLNDLLLEPEVSKPYRESYQQRKPLRTEPLLAFFEELQNELKKAAPGCADGQWVVAEYKNAIWMLEILTRIRARMEADSCKNQVPGETGADGVQPLPGAKNVSAECRELSAQIDRMLAEHHRLWMNRNKPYGVEQGEQIFCRLQAGVEEKGDVAC